MDFEYTIANNQVTITKYTGTSKDVTIPNEIEGLPVTTIAIYAFYSNKLTSINLPQNLTTIRQSAFRNNRLTSISLPQNCTTIGYFTFADNELTSISLPQNYTTIGNFAFHNNFLTSISLPQNCTTIGENAFHYNMLTSINLPQNLKTIGEWAFRANMLTSISLPNKFRTKKHIKYIFDFSLEEFENRNKKFIKPCLAKILEDYVHHHFYDIIIDYMMIPSNELIQEVMETYKN